MAQRFAARLRQGGVARKNKCCIVARGAEILSMQVGPGNLKPGPAALARAKKSTFASQAQVFLGDPKAVFGFT